MTPENTDDDRARRPIRRRAVRRDVARFDIGIVARLAVLLAALSSGAPWSGARAESVSAEAISAETISTGARAPSSWTPSGREDLEKLAVCVSWQGERIAEAERRMNGQALEWTRDHQRLFQDLDAHARARRLLRAAMDADAAAALVEALVPDGFEADDPETQKARRAACMLLYTRIRRG